MGCPAADIFARAADANRDDPRRSGNVVTLGDSDSVLAAGDIHGNRKNFSAILSYANLGGSPQRRLILQEVIHGPIDPRSGQDRSVDLLLRAARTKVDHREQVLFLLGNHDIAELTGREITKEGAGTCKAFRAGVEYAFGDDAGEVGAAIDEFLRSMPMMIRCANGVALSHSLPSPGRWRELPKGPYSDDDLRRGGAVYEWTWGRRQSPQCLQDMADALDANYFVLGHQHVEEGYRILSPLAVTLASDHRRGYVMEFSTDQQVSADTVEAQLRPIAGLGGGG